VRKRATVAFVMDAYLLIIGDRVPLRWVLEQRMAFPNYRRGAASRLAEGDALLLYTTRGCFHNPGRDRGRVIGSAAAMSAPVELEEPVVIDGVRYPVGCDIELRKLAPKGQGVELAPLVLQMTTFTNKRAWAATIRRPLLKLTKEDTNLLARELKSVVVPAREAIDSYLDVTARRVDAA
jgi:hypothetical protein